MDTLQVTHEIISHILSPLFNARTLQGIEMVCFDEKIRRCIPKLTAWLADYMENATLHCIATNRCPIYIAPVVDFGELLYQTFDFHLYHSYVLRFE